MTADPPTPPTQDRLAEIEAQLPTAGYWSENVKWLIAELKRLRDINKALVR